MLQIVGLIFILALIYAVKAIAIAKQSGELAQMSASFSWMHARKQDAEMAEAEIRMIPQNRAKIDDPDMIEQMESLLEMLDENDDVQNVWHNWDVDEDDSEDE